MKTISVQELKRKLDNQEDFIFLDVREPWEYAEANLGAKLIPLGSIMNMAADEISDQKDKEVIVHCRSGKRSANACYLLEQMGFTQTVNVEGGILAWQALYS